MKCYMYADLFRKYLEGHTKSVLLKRGTYALALLFDIRNRVHVNEGLSDDYSPTRSVY